MLARLRHHALVSGDHKREQVDPMRSGQHVLDETLVTRHVDKPDAKIVELKIGKTEIDSNAAPFLFGQTVRIGTGQSTHEGALPVIDVTCCANNQRRHVSH